MTNYRRGADLERQVRKALYDRGAVLVIRSAGSKSPVDLVAFHGVTDRTTVGIETKLEFVQVKRDGKLYAQHRHDFIQLAHQCGAVPVLASKGPRGQPVVFQVLEEKPCPG